jgi:5-methylcytosine-specific restriction endonuclease McrA
MPGERIGSIYKRTNRTNAENDQEAYLELDSWFQRGEVWTTEMKIKLIETLLLGYALNPIWVIITGYCEKDEKDEELMLDGKQRITAICSFMNNGFTLTDIVSDELKFLVGKHYKDFPGNIKAKIRDYEICVNKYGPDLLENRDKLMDIYYRLNSSSVKLNDFELMKPIYDDFYKILDDYKDDFLNSCIFLTSKSNRGEIENIVIQILALSEKDLPKFSSFPNLADKWQETNLGSTILTVEKSIQKNEKDWRTKLDFLKYIMNKFDECDLFQKNKANKIQNLVIMTRCAALIKDKAYFNRHFENLKNKFKKDIYEKDVQEILNCKAKNSKYQKDLIQMINDIIVNELGEVLPRCYSDSMKIKKLEEQNGICLYCNKIIDTKKDKYQGDHIMSWFFGGQTTMENCQVLHKECHRLKTLGINNQTNDFIQATTELIPDNYIADVSAESN